MIQFDYFGLFQMGMFNHQLDEVLVYMGVSKNKGTPKWMVYNGKPY